jgi:hypothetical protein
MSSAVTAIETGKSNRPVPAKWLSRGAKAIFYELVDDLSAAGVAVAKADGHAIGMAALCLASAGDAAREMQKARRLERKEPVKKLAAKHQRAAQAAGRALARFERDSQTWLVAIAATPAARARLGIRPTKRKPGAVSDLLATRQRLGIIR